LAFSSFGRASGPYPDGSWFDPSKANKTKTMVPYQAFIIFKTDKLYEDEITVNGQKLYFDSSFEPQKHVRIYGEVVNVPREMGNWPIPTQRHEGTPPYYDKRETNLVRIKDIEPVVMVGDRIYFHFNTLIGPQNVVFVESLPDNKKMFYYRVRYDDVICAVRDGGIIMVGSYTLIEPDYETWEDILVPTYTMFKDKHGKFIPRPKEQWIQKKVEPGYRHLKGFVRHVGEPFKMDKREVNVGDHIVYKKNFNWEMEIEGKRYFAIRQRHIEGRFVNEPPIA
jgi:hypothetical protein